MAPKEDGRAAQKTTEKGGVTNLTVILGDFGSTAKRSTRPRLSREEPLIADCRPGPRYQSRRSSLRSGKQLVSVRKQLVSVRGNNWCRKQLVSVQISPRKQLVSVQISPRETIGVSSDFAPEIELTPIYSRPLPSRFAFRPARSRVKPLRLQVRTERGNKGRRCRARHRRTVRGASTSTKAPTAPGPRRPVRQTRSMDTTPSAMGCRYRAHSRDRDGSRVTA